jgi:hypothetical protein
MRRATAAPEQRAWILRQVDVRQPSTPEKRLAHLGRRARRDKELRAEREAEWRALKKRRAAPLHE